MFDDLAAFQERIIAFEVTARADDELCAAAVALARLRSSVAIALGHVLGELDVRGTTDAEVGLRTPTWLAREAGIPGRVARDDLAVGRVLRALPVVDEATVDGRISSHHVAAVAAVSNPRVADGLAGVQAEIVTLADGALFETWRQDIAMTVRLIDQDGGYDPATDLATNRLRVSATLDGLTEVTGRLTGEHALVVRHAVEVKADELFRRFSADHDRCPDVEVPDRPTLRALALADLCRAGGAVDETSTRPPRPEVTIVVRADEPHNPVTATGARCQDGSTRTLCCDADLFAVVVDSLGVPLDLGRHVRLASTAQRRAVAARDGGCVFPGCEAPITWADMHHVQSFEKLGRTAVENLAALCRHHHGVTHRLGWAMHATSDGWFWWEAPNGQVFWSQRHGRVRAAPPPGGTSRAAGDETGRRRAS
jgi:hypothetical protein